MLNCKKKKEEDGEEKTDETETVNIPPAAHSVQFLPARPLGATQISSIPDTVRHTIHRTGEISTNAALAISVKYGGSRVIIYGAALLSEDLSSESPAEPDN